MKKIFLFLLIAFVVGFIARISYAALLSEQVIFNNVYDSTEVALTVIFTP